jgi:hypothetical protein
MTADEFQTCLRLTCDAFLRRQLLSSQMFEAQTAELVKLAKESGLPENEIKHVNVAEFTRLTQQTNALIERARSGSKLN